MNTDSSNLFEAQVEQMCQNIAIIEDVINRPLTEEERGNLSLFVRSLDLFSQEEIETRIGQVL